MEPQTSEIAGRYVVESTLGSGGAAAVYRATDRVSGTKVALKRLSLGSERYRDRLLALFERERIEANPRHRSTALTVKSIICLQQGDWTKARDLKRQAELFDMESDTKQIFAHTNVKNELDVFALGGDLGAVKRIAEILDRLAAKYPGWLPSAHTARAEYARLRGDLDSALTEFEHCIALSEPSTFDQCPDMAWYPAAGGKMETLIDLGRAADAKAWGERALRFSGGRPTGTRYHGVKRALALAEAKLGDFGSAHSRLQSLIEERIQLGTTGAFLGILYEAAAYVSLWARDESEFQRFASLAAREYLEFPSSGFNRRYEAMLEAGESLASKDSAPPALPIADARPRVEATTLVSEAMRSVSHARLRAQRGLALLCERGKAAGGHLYLLSGSELTHVASESEVASPDPALASMLRAWFADALDDEAETRMGDGDSTSVGGTEPVWTSADGNVYHPVAIRASFGGSSSPVGVAALRYDSPTVAVAALAEIASALGEYFLQTGAVTIRSKMVAS